VNLAPADIRKEGSGFDLPMALGIFGAYGGLNQKELLDRVFVEELPMKVDGDTLLSESQHYLVDFKEVRRPADA
jgi:predicted ATPase with chaperone activity